MSRPTAIAQSKKRNWARAILPVKREKELWQKWLESDDAELSHKTFMRLTEYLYGKPIQPVAGDGDGSPVRIEFRGLDAS
jgi:hypothetical protein